MSAQDGGATALAKIPDVHRAPIAQLVRVKSSGVVKKMDGELIERASVLLGVGRQKAGDAIDFAVGLSNIKKVDERIERGDQLLLIHAHNDATIRSVQPLLEKGIAVD